MKSIIDLAANMEMDSVAEGVDTEATAALLEQYNVGAMQGFLIAAPMPVEAIPAWLAIWQAGGGTDPATPLSPAQRAAGIPNKSATNVAGRRIEEQAVAPSGSTPAATPDAVASSARQLVLEVLQDQRKPINASALSARQLEVMQLLTEGCSVKQIARRLDLGIGTVKVHLSRAYPCWVPATRSRR